MPKEVLSVEAKKSEHWVKVMREMNAGSGIPGLDALLVADCPESQCFAEFLNQLLEPGLATRKQIELLLDRLKIFPGYFGLVQESLEKLSSALTACSGDLKAAADVTRSHLDDLIARFPIGEIDEHGRFSKYAKEDRSYVRDGYALI